MAEENTFKAANQAVEKAGQYAYRDRKVKKKETLEVYGYNELTLVAGYTALNILFLLTD